MLVPFFITRTDTVVVTVADKVDMVAHDHRDWITPALVILGWVVVHLFQRRLQKDQFRAHVVHGACQAVNADLLRYSRFLDTYVALLESSVDKHGNLLPHRLPGNMRAFEGWDWWSTVTGNETILSPVVERFRAEADEILKEDVRIRPIRDSLLDECTRMTLADQEQIATRVRALAAEIHSLDGKADAFRLRVVREVYQPKPRRWWPLSLKRRER